jgi:DNA-binding phage protein
MTIELNTRAWNAAENLNTEEDMAAYLEAALEDGDPGLIGAYARRLLTSELC